MPTYVSMINWTGRPQPQPRDIRAAIEPQSYDLRARGMCSLVFLPDKGVCAAVMVSVCTSDDEVASIADAILPGAGVRIDSMRFDDDPALPTWIAREVDPGSPGDELYAVYEAVLAIT